jgi:hypothetical protein
MELVNLFMAHKMFSFYDIYDRTLVECPLTYIGK